MGIKGSLGVEVSEGIRVRALEVCDAACNVCLNFCIAIIMEKLLELFPAVDELFLIVEIFSSFDEVW